MKIKAFAKINLTLDILRKREDGYHDIDSVMQQVSLCDFITLKCSDNITVSCDKSEIDNTDNIVYFAAKNFFDFTGISGGAEINIKKNIPLSAGLGGGSSDAAAVINGLNILYKTNLQREELIKIGLKTGADVPFCLFGKTARVMGIGEKVTPIKHLNGFYAVILKNGQKKSTGEMYRLIDTVNSREPKTDKFISEINSNTVSFQNVGNDFLSVAEQDNNLALLKKYMPLCASLSGSGPSIFAVFDREDTAKFAADDLKNRGLNAYFCEFI